MEKEIAGPRTVLVAGASSGIGRAVALRFLGLGHRVIGMARTPERLDAGAARDRYEPLVVDFERLEELRAVLDARRDLLATVDIAVIGAGRGAFGHVEQFSYEAIRGLIELNFLSQAWLARALVPGMKTRGRGELVFIGSEAALSGRRQGAVYCASKFALRGFAQALRDECAASGVRVSMVHPGLVRTPFFDDLDFEPGEAPENWVEPEDVAAAVELVAFARPGTVFEEIRVSPLKNVIRRKRGGSADRPDGGRRQEPV